MAFHVFAPRRPSLAAVFLAALTLVVVLAPAGARAADPVDAATLSAQEAAMVAALNQDRTERGRIAVRVDSRLMSIARARSDDMVAKGYFSHTQPDGRNVFDILTAQHITWYNAGEIIAWNNYPMDSTVSAANRQWMGSAGHKAIIISTDYNYVGVGLAVDPGTGKKVWTAVYLKGPDRTPARAAWATSTIGTTGSAGSRRVSLKWSGSDPRLQVLTAGLKAFSVQRRVDGGPWATVWSGTTATTGALTLATGHVYDIRIAAVDKRGNWSDWKTQRVDLRRMRLIASPRT
jgi:uncharacterized protein YkwD